VEDDREKAYNTRLLEEKSNELKDEKQTPDERMMLVGLDYVWDDN